MNKAEGRPDVDAILSVDSFSLQRALEVDSSFMDSGSDSDGEIVFGEEECRKPGDVEVRRTEASARSGQQKEQQGASLGLPEMQKLSDMSLKEKEPKRRKKLMHDTLGIGSVGITARGPLHEWRFNMFMKDFFAEKARDIIRCKGVLCIKGYEDTKFVFQGVHDNIVFGPSQDGWVAGEERISQIVFIGKNLNRKGLMDALRSCVWTPLPAGWREEMDPESREPVYIHESGTRQHNIPAYASPHLESTQFIPTAQPKGLLPN